VSAHLAGGVVCRRRDVRDAHVDEAAEVADKPIADKTQQRPYVQLHLLLAQPDAELLHDGGERRVDVAHHLAKCG
jgi:hypothetical protein